MDPNFTIFPDYVEDENSTFTNEFNYLVSCPDHSSISMDVPFVCSDSGVATFTSSDSVSSKEVSCSTATGWTREGYSLSQNDGNEASDPVLEYITRILMEEDSENVLWGDKDQLALRDTELSLYQVLGAEHFPPADQPQQFLNQIVEIPGAILSGNSIENGSNSHPVPIPGTRSGTDNLSASNVENHNPSLLRVPFMVENMFSDVESILQIKRGFEEGSQFLPKIDLKINNFASNLKVGIPNAIDKEDRHERRQPTDGSRGRKNQGREERDLEEERSIKQSAISMEERELSELFDKVLLFRCKPAEIEAVKSGTLVTNKRPIASKGRKTRSKRQGKKAETIDFMDLLILCAQAVSSSNYKVASDHLKQIRKHGSPVGNGSQRLAHYFANGLEARMKGSGNRIQNFYVSLASTKASSADILGAYNVIITALPYELVLSFANRNICKVAEKAKALHIVDFGILLGYQWPTLIELLSIRDGGPPKLRITGIEFPQQGFKPAERIEEAGRLLARYCERFNVPFEYNGIALQDWESFRLEDLKIDRKEMLAVNNLYRFESLLDVRLTPEVECARNVVLRIIRSMNPDIFVHSVINGTFNNPFFVTRFRGALFYYSSIFDAYDTIISREEPGRFMFEEAFYGGEVMNVVACEGSERTYRPETYKQWQVRNMQAGFKQVLLDQEVNQFLREKLKTQYHKDFAIEEDGNWMLLRWKGRVLYAWSCWVPSSLEIPTNMLFSG